MCGGSHREIPQRHSLRRCHAVVSVNVNVAGVIAGTTCKIMRVHPLHMCGEVTSLSEAAVAERAAMVALLLVDNEDMAQ